MAVVTFLVRRVGVARAKVVKEAAAQVQVGDVLKASGITYLMASAYSSEVGS